MNLIHKLISSLIVSICSLLAFIGPDWDSPASSQFQASSLEWMPKDQLLSVTLYHPKSQAENGLQIEEEPEEFRKAMQQGNTLVIGNGGAGAAGLFQHLAEVYNSGRAESSQIVLGWKFADSHMNYRSIEKSLGECDLYVTYEPAYENHLQEKGYVKRVIRLFNDEFPLIGPGSNPANLHPSADPVDNMGRIILYALSLEDKTAPVYFSRWNHSAMGVKDQMLWGSAASRLAGIFMVTEQVPPLRAEVEAQLRHVLAQKEMDYQDRFGQITQILLTTFTEQHVAKPGGERVFPAGAISAALDADLYAITDGALIAQYEIKNYQGSSSDKEEKCVTFNHGDKDFEGHILTNPAQLLVPPSFERFPEGSPQRKFLTWLTSEEGRNAICQFTVKGCKSKEIHPYNGHVEQDSYRTALKVARQGENFLIHCGVPKT